MHRIFKRNRHFFIAVFAFFLGLFFGLWLNKNIRIFRRILRCQQMIYMVGSGQRPQSLKQEVRSTEFLLVAVLIKTQHLKWKGGTLYHDFSETNTKCIFFTTKPHSSSHPRNVVYLDGTTDSSEIEAIYSRMLSYVSRQYKNDFNWFLLTESSFFVNEEKLNFLENLDHSKEFLFLPEVTRDSGVDKNRYRKESKGSIRVTDISKRFNESRASSKVSYRRTTVDNSSAHKNFKGYHGSNVELVRLFQPGVIMSKLLLHKLITAAGHCLDKRNDFLPCFEKKVKICFQQDGNSTNGKTKTFNSCHSEDFKTKTATADLSQNLECMSRVRVQQLSDRILVLSKNSRVLQNRLKILTGFISSTVYDKIEEIRTAYYTGLQQKEQFNRMFTHSKKYLINSKVSWSLRYQELEGVKRLIRTMMATIREAHQEDIQFHSLYYGYEQNHPIKGVQHMFSIFTNKERHIARSRREFGAIQFRVLEPPQKTPVSIVVPLAGKLKSFRQFMINLENNILKKEEQISILVVYFPETSPFSEHKKIFDTYNTTYTRSKFNWLNLPGVFARAQAFQAAVEFCTHNELLFFADVDLDFNIEFLQRCRDNTVAKQQVYFPVMFKLFNPKIIGFTLNSSHYFRSFDRRLGDWALYSFGPVCVYRDDVIAAGGFNVHIKEWGYEDIHFFKSFVSKRKYDIIRAADPGLLHIYHVHSNCDVIRNNIQRLMCKGAMLNGLASKESTVNYLLEKMYFKI